MIRGIVNDTKNRCESRKRLKILLKRLEGLNAKRRKLRRILKFERLREVWISDRENRETKIPAKEAELIREIRVTELLIDRTVTVIGDLAFDLGLIGVNLW